MPSLGGAASGFATGAGIGSFVPGIGNLVGGGIGALIGGLFGHHGDDKDKKRAEIQPYLDQLQSSSTGLRKQASDFGQMGAGPLGMSLDYLRNILSANGQQAMAAVAPEEGRVIDQYDTARKAISSFSPRGGGTTSALAQSRLSQAGDISDLFTGARREAFGQAASLGTSLEGLSLSGSQLASADLQRILDSILTEQGFDVQQHGQNMAALGELGQGVGTLLGLFLTRNKPTAGR